MAKKKLEKINVALVGVGNCANSLYQGLTYYAGYTGGKEREGGSWEARVRKSREREACRRSKAKGRGWEECQVLLCGRNSKKENYVWRCRSF